MKNWRMYILLLLIIVLTVSCYLAFSGCDITVIGLSQNILGSIVVAVFGIPQPDFSTEISLALSLPDEEKLLQKTQGRRKFWHIGCSYLGIALLIIGFVLQLWDRWKTNSP